MTQTLETLAKRISTTEDLRSIVRTMKTLSAVSIHQYELAVSAIADYNRTIDLGLEVILKAHMPEPRLRRAAALKVALLVFGSDHGLCGRFNDQVVEHALNWLAKRKPTAQSHIWLTVGARAAARVEAHGETTAASHFLPGSITGLTATVGAILVNLDQWQAEGRCDRVMIFHNHRAAGGTTEPTVMQLLPTDPDYWATRLHAPWESRSLPMFTMQAEKLFSALVRQHLFVRLFLAGAESLAAEHAARLAAMQSAERNISETLQDMVAAFRRQRQDAITAELLDIVAGYRQIQLRT